MNKIKISKKDLESLKAKDPILSKYIEESLIPSRYYADSFFISIVQALIGQLISNKSASTIYSRLNKLLNTVTVDNFLNEAEANIIACGIYKKKYDQIQIIAKSVKSGILDARELILLTDKEIIEILSNYAGIGLWSAQMIMMHGLKRPDILAFGDFGVRSGIMKVYGLDSLCKSEFNEIKKRLSPYGTIASLYFWQAHTKE